VHELYTPKLARSINYSRLTSSIITGPNVVLICWHKLLCSCTHNLPAIYGNAVTVKWSFGNMQIHRERTICIVNSLCVCLMYT